MSARHPGLGTVLRDTATWVGGWVIIFKQAGIIFPPPAQVNETLIWIAAILVGVPGAAQGLLWVARFGTASSTGESPSRSVSSASSPSSPGEPSRGAEQ